MKHPHWAQLVGSPGQFFARNAFLGFQDYKNNMSLFSPKCVLAVTGKEPVASLVLSPHPCPRGAGTHGGDQTPKGSPRPRAQTGTRRFGFYVLLFALFFKKKDSHSTHYTAIFTFYVIL